MVERRLEALLSEHRLLQVTPSQANALMILFQEKQPLTARALASQMRLSEVTVGRFVRSLEMAGWILRTPHPTDARAILLAPSPRAYRAFDRFLLVSNALLECGFRDFRSSEIAELNKLAQRMTQNLAFSRADDGEEAPRSRPRASDPRAGRAAARKASGRGSSRSASEAKPPSEAPVKGARAAQRSKAGAGASAKRRPKTSAKRRASPSRS